MDVIIMGGASPVWPDPQLWDEELLYFGERYS